jgi:hypothetical protein
MASANILKLQKEQKNAQKAKMIKQQQRRTSSSRRTSVGSIKKMTMQKAHKDDLVEWRSDALGQGRLRHTEKL